MSAQLNPPQWSWQSSCSGEEEGDTEDWPSSSSARGNSIAGMMNSSDEKLYGELVASISAAATGSLLSQVSSHWQGRHSRGSSSRDSILGYWHVQLATRQSLKRNMMPGSRICCLLYAGVLTYSDRHVLVASYIHANFNGQIREGGALIWTYCSYVAHQMLCYKNWWNELL